ncbi:MULTISPECIES: hypothetical protein [unclassified Pseudoalteromonas]|uniref:hypothetical protein n=1 Tax=unclassified Pseudoalteromonas TaxID=194690 RepID=UPI001108C217|nr:MULTISPECIES: hypothetical protein [unclassified Pseudoalteromonas]TMO44718.1 hypothetical protein CWC25_08950 [Pseudoalteromonas sp. S4389]
MNDKIKQVFKISYDTSETKDHTIDAELLGNAIVNTASVLKHADKVINGDDSSIDLDVRANNQGSFVIEFVTWLNSTGINPLSLLGFSAAPLGVKTLLEVLGEIQSRPVASRIDLGNGTSKIILKDGSEVEADSNVARLIVDRTFRKDLEKVIKAPLDGASNAKLVIRDEKDDEVSLYEEEQVKDFKTPSREIIEEIKEETESKEVRFVKVNFSGSTGWTAELTSGEVISVKMKDESFLSLIEENKRVSKGDLFVVKLKTTTKFKTGTSPSITREVIKVERHRVAKVNKLVPDNE